MIFTVTLNPALDRLVVVDHLVDDDTTRVLGETRYAAGKGIDVSRVVRELGGQSVAMGLVGGYDGLELEGRLINAGVMTHFTRISDETRTNIILREEGSRRQFVISAEGPQIKPTEIGDLYESIRQSRGVSYLVLSGSLPRGVTPNFYGQLILAGKEKNAFTLLDADGQALRDSIDFQPTCIKPNTHELGRLVGREVREQADIVEACVELHERGIPHVLVSRGKDGILLSTREHKIRGVAPQVEVESTVGAGDSSVAGFVLAHSRGEELPECVRWACAAGTATAKTPGTELCHRKDVEELLPLVEVTSL